MARFPLRLRDRIGIGVQIDAVGNARGGSSPNIVEPAIIMLTLVILAVTAANDRELHARTLYGLPVDSSVVLAHIDADARSADRPADVARYRNARTGNNRISIKRNTKVFAPEILVPRSVFRAFVNDNLLLRKNDGLAIVETPAGGRIAGFHQHSSPVIALSRILGRRGSPISCMSRDGYHAKRQKRRNREGRCAPRFCKRSHTLPPETNPS